MVGTESDIEPDVFIWTLNKNSVTEVGTYKTPGLNKVVKK
jgi:hypothetical protein